MICVCIGRGRHRHMIAEHRHLAEQGARLVEVRLDYISGAVNIRRLITDRPCPVVITCRRAADGGKWAGSEEQRQLLLRTAIAEGVEYVNLEDDIAAGVPRFGKTKRIVSFHDFRKTPDNLDEIHRRLSQCDPDVVKLATMVNHPSDNVRILGMIRKAKIPTVGLGMGDIGVPTRILAGRFGAPFTYATFHHERALAPGQLSFEHMTQVYRYEQIDSKTEVYGVVADPIGHSLSPLIHNAGFARLGLNKVYVPFRVPREDLGRFIDEAGSLGIRGLSITIPHKEEVIKKLTKIDEAVQGIGAANTVVFDGKVRAGYNTDYHAAMSSLEEAMEISSPGEKSFAGMTALVMGCGGAGMAVTYGLVRRGARVLVSDIAPRKAEASGRALRLPGRRLGRPPQGESRHPHQQHAGRHAPQRRRKPLREAPPAAFDGRFRRCLQSREHAPDQGRPQPQLHGRYRDRDVRPPGLSAVQVFHRP